MTATGANRENVHRFDSSKTARRIMSEQTRDNIPPDYCERLSEEDIPVGCRGSRSHGTQRRAAFTQSCCCDAKA
ncbi:hypothetical protein ACVWW6_007786 [Bradyrhizobium sp. USDA 3311]|nr:hypothetical protein [Bradyrhizobium japonicum]